MSLLIAILVLVVVVAGGVGMTLLYRAALTEQRARLSELAQSQTRLIEAITEHELVATGKALSPRIRAVVFSQVQAAHSSFDTAGQTTEIAIAQQQGDQILYLLRHKQHADQAPQSLPLNTPLAEPMRLALAGKSGTLIGTDYRGQTVLAAYDPVGALGWGIVIKRDMSEIRAPFWRAGLVAGLCGMGAVAMGAWAFIGVTAPMLKHLRDSEDQLRRAVKHAPFPMMIHAEDGRVLLTSNAWNRLSGYEPHEISTLSDWIERAYGQQQEGHRQRFAGLYETDGPIAESEHEIRTAQGQKRVWDFSSAPLGQTPEGTRLAISMAVDVTERKEAEQALAAEKEQLQVTLNSIGDAVITAGVDGNVVMMNPVAQTLTGWLLEEARDKPLTQVFHIIHQHTRRACENPVEKVLQTGGIIGLANHTALIGRDGTERIIADSGAPIVNSQGQIIGVVLVFRDNTAIDQANQALRSAKEAAESANRAKDRFLAALSHELRTPLTPVLATLSMLQDDGRLAAPLGEDVAMMRHHIEVECRLIDDLLDLTRIAHGQLRMEFQTVDVHEMLERAMSVASQSIDTHRLTIRRELGASHFHVRADPARLQQVFWNIIRNAMQYTADEGTLIIRTSNTAGGEWEAQFIDSGIGMEAEFLPQVFEAFERGNEGASHRPGGLGLGMAIARSILLQLGGSIHAASEGSGKGSTFTIRIPVVSAQEPTAPRATTVAGDAKALRILLVDDDDSTLKVLTRLLKNHGHEVKTATCVQDAIAAGGRETFDLLLSDLGLPDGSGLDIMRWFSRHHPIKGIVFSGYGMDTDVEASKEAGFSVHLVKPVVAQRLIQAIQQAVAG